MGRFFDCEYADGQFRFERNEERIRQYESIDGFHVITTDIDVATMDTEGTRSRYKSLAHVEQAFRSLKTASSRVLKSGQRVIIGGEVVPPLLHLRSTLLKAGDLLDVGLCVKA